jgi:hypothetical protein
VPVRRHLACDDTLDVRLESDVVDDEECPVRRRDDDRAPVLPLEAERARAGQEANGGGERPGSPVDVEGEAAAEPVRAGRQLPAPVSVLNEERRIRGDLDGRSTGGEQHADAPDGRRSELGALVVVGEDLAVRPAVLGKAVGTVLAHADPVAKAEAVEDEDRRGRPRFTAEGEREQEDDQGRDAAHGTDTASCRG